MGGWNRMEKTGESFCIGKWVITTDSYGCKQYINTDKISFMEVVESLHDEYKYTLYIDGDNLDKIYKFKNIEGLNELLSKIFKASERIGQAG